MRPLAPRRQSGQATVLVAMMMVAIFGMAALAFDAGFAMSDRRLIQSDADAAALAGARSYPSGGASQANYVAMQYLARNLGFTLPVGACTSASACAPGSYTTGAFTVGLQDSDSLQAIDVSVQHRRPASSARPSASPPS